MAQHHRVYFHVPSAMTKELRHLLLILEDADQITQETRDRATLMLIALSGINANPPSDAECVHRSKV